MAASTTARITLEVDSLAELVADLCASTTTRLTLKGETAANLMTPNPISIGEDATLQEALIMFTEKRFSAAPVIDESGEPVGVISHSDIIVHERENVQHLAEVPEFYNRVDLTAEVGERLNGFQVEKVDRTRVRDLMTPAVFSVPADMPCPKVIEQFVVLNVHRLFVVDADNTLVGVISAMDILRHLKS